MPRCALLKLRSAHGAAAAQASFTLPKRLIKAVRFVPAVRLGFLSFIAENVGCAFCASPLGFYGMAAVGLLHPSATASIAGMLTARGAEAGIGQGELQAAIANLRQIGMAVAPVFWSEVYQLGVARGVPGALYLGATAAQALNLLLTAGLAFEG